MGGPTIDRKLARIRELLCAKRPIIQLIAAFGRSNPRCYPRRSLALTTELATLGPREEPGTDQTGRQPCMEYLILPELTSAATALSG